MIARDQVTLGILAGGRGSRLGGCDKAWIVRNGVSQIERMARRFECDVARVLVSANRDPEKFAALGFEVVPDRVPDLGPLGGLDALAHACATPWLLAVPVDLVRVDDGLLPALASAGGQGASVEDDDGVQPLVALWRVEALRSSFPRRREPRLDDLSVQSLQSTLGMPRIRLQGIRFGNLNTFDDLAAVGATIPR